MAMRAIEKLMAVPKARRDQQWLQDSLQEAIEIEFSTIPPYLFAWWSIKDDPSDVAGTLESIAEEEMRHMTIAANILAGIGGHPQFIVAGAGTPQERRVVPTYPSKLKAGVHANLTVDLAPLDRNLLLNKLMVIEEPVQILAEDNDFKPSGEKTIGLFYADIIEALRALQPPFNEGVQVAAFGPAFKNAAEAIKDGIELILRQGEGGAGTPFEKPGELGHFYLFGEIYHGRKLQLEADGVYRYTGVEVKLPGVYQVPANPQPSNASLAFNQAYSRMLDLLQKAWDQPATGDASVSDAVTEMTGLPALASQLFQAGAGPSFTYIPGSTAVPQPVPAPAPVPVTGRFARVKELLDQVVAGAPSVGPHGPFWRPLTRDKFVEYKFAGQKLIVAGDPAQSALVKALRGQAPFGKDIGTPGATFRRMPAGEPPMPEADIAFIESWIAAGAPGDPAVPLDFSFTAGAHIPADQHNAFFRALDEWSLINRTPEVDAAIGEVFGAFNAWQAFAANVAARPAWVAQISSPGFRAAAALLSANQKATVDQQYGTPVPLLALLEAYQLFGADQLPDDPQRPDDQRHRMDGAIMWFVWSSFGDACVELGLDTDFWSFLLRPVLCGLISDGVFRGRYPVTGFGAAGGAVPIFHYVQTLTNEQVRENIRLRFVQSGL